MTSSRALTQSDFGLEGTDAEIQGTIRVKDGRALVKVEYLGSAQGLGRLGPRAWSRLHPAARTEGATSIRVETTPVIEHTGRRMRVLSKLGFRSRPNGTMFYEGQL